MTGVLTFEAAYERLLAAGIDQTTQLEGRLAILADAFPEDKRAEAYRNVLVAAVLTLNELGIERVQALAKGNNERSTADVIVN